MTKWIFIALSPIVLLIIIEEATEYFWKRRLNGPDESKERKWKAVLVEKYQRSKAFISESRIIMSIVRPKWIVNLKNKRKQASQVKTFKREEHRGRNEHF